MTETTIRIDETEAHELSVRLLLVPHNLMAVSPIGEQCLCQVYNGEYDPLRALLCPMQSREAKNLAGHPLSHSRRRKCLLGKRIRRSHCEVSHFVPINIKVEINILDAPHVYA